ncbi:MAG: DEAD/DEAH box helicase, partial [Lachnospiraceae bacterium]|nr:DEAD/DEAH box helicase [Lachnospiraceae bacterium]
IEAVKADMESRRIMDRLICGDVGFGKTEIAIRAAFKAVQDSKQVAYLVPTTVLAQQHFLTFSERMREYPIRVGLLSRFRTPAEIRKTLADLKSGALDIVIGTHRLLSKDVVFKDLGLLIIDEEQRFGVSDKEKLKKLRENVDVISLTATPIPRTLHMSLIGIRDMSMLKDPPMDRLPIQTYVAEYNDEIVREAIARELARGGQVYYICSKVKNIERVTARIARLVPEAEVSFAHGQMRERELERIMYDFVNGAIDVLVSTTIVETGLDIPNVNTIIIQDSDRFGLAQLYQLRGRVGRSNRTAYAFLFYQRGILLKDVAEKRLSAIRDYTELGSGVKISMRDLELRGAGNLLGAEQHGHMQAVGYELYAKLLGEAVSREKGEAEQIRFDTTVEAAADANIPSSYIANEAQKLAIYRRISEIETAADYDDVLDELIDRFGDLPRPVDNLLKIALIKARAHRLYITELQASLQGLRLKFLPEAPLEPQAFVELLQDQKGRLRLKAEEAPVLTMPLKKGEVLRAAALLTTVSELLDLLEGRLLPR